MAMTTESSDASGGSTSEEPEEEDELQVDIIYENLNHLTHWVNATRIVVGVDPGPSFTGFDVICETPGRDNIVTHMVRIGSKRGGEPVEKVSAFAVIPWHRFCPPRDPRVFLRIEKQEQRNFGTFREDNTLLAGVIAGSANCHGITHIKMISASVKLGKPMLSYCCMPIDTVVPRGPSKRIARKKLGVDVFRSFLCMTSNTLALIQLDKLKQAHGLFDVCDAGLTAVSLFKEDAEDEKPVVKAKRRKIK